jgi:hypothetical protein
MDGRVDTLTVGDILAVSSFVFFKSGHVGRS